MARKSPHGVAKRELERLVRRVGARGQRRLPPEEQLSVDLSCSRPTVRSALLSLQKEGLIQRRHGRGTFINRHALDVGANLASGEPFTDLLAAEGHDAGLEVRSVDEIDADEGMAKRLGVDLGAPLRMTDRVYTAGGKPAVVSVDLVRAEILSPRSPKNSEEHSVYSLIESWSEHQVNYSVADVEAHVATEMEAEALDIESGTPLLQLEHLHIDDDDMPVAFTRAHVRQEFLRFTVIRDRLNA